MSSLLDHLSMEPYGLYVWPAYAITAIALAWVLIQSLHALRCNRRQLEALRSDRKKAL